MFKLTLLWLALSMIALPIFAQKPDFWIEKNQITPLSQPLNDSLPWEYFMSNFPEAKNIQAYSNPNTYKLLLRFQEGEMQYSLEVCSESWGDGIYTAYHIHNSAFFKRKIINEVPDWSLIQAIEVRQAIQQYLQENEIDWEKVDVFEFGQHDWQDSKGFSQAEPEKMLFRYGVYDGKTLYVFDEKGRKTTFKKDNDYHWSY